MMTKKAFWILFSVIVVIMGAAIFLAIYLPSRSEEKNIAEELEETNTTNSLTSPSSSNRDRNPAKGDDYPGDLLKSSIATRETISSRTGKRIKRNAYWLTGNDVNDQNSLNGIKKQARQGKVPVVVMKMRPSQGLNLNEQDRNWEYYKPTPPHLTWQDYDKSLSRFTRALSSVPCLVVLEPDLLMYTTDSDNQQYRWMNAKYEEEFLERAQRVVNRLPRSWVYIDAGNADFLSKNMNNLEFVSTALLRVNGIRGFSINTMHYVNRTFNEVYARRIYCRTGLHYIVDTSRNGGDFSMQALSRIRTCLFDPPNMKEGQDPGWSWGRNHKPLSPRYRRWIRQPGSSYSSSSSSGNTNAPDRASAGTNRNHGNNNRLNPSDQNYDVESYNNRINNQGNNNNGNQQSNNNQVNPRPTQHHITPASSNSESNNENSQVTIRSVQEATEHMRGFKSHLRRCMSQKSFTTAHDANLWIKAPGESDGRLYSYGTYHSCLINHKIGCDDSCQMLISANSRPANCDCEGQGSNSDAAQAFPFANYGG
ncbi:uncharacterized protein LOC143461810 [Clavelina lepadiformis]|uniref:uncharacterized protein LOC143461810 n=1 Tax=Clavelina lepadiformis TaxID=159417 RepID=UPI0040429A39